MMMTVFSDDGVRNDADMNTGILSKKDLENCASNFISKMSASSVKFLKLI